MLINPVHAEIGYTGNPYFLMNSKMIQRKRTANKILIMKLKRTALEKRFCSTLNYTKKL